MKSYKWAVLMTVFLACMNTLEAQTKKGIFRDSLDHAFDISNWLLDLHGFVPVVSPITEPAVGYGATVAGVYFIKRQSHEKSTGFQMPDMASLAGGYTQNGTWFGGGGYLGFWKNNAIWYRGILGFADINLEYYGTGSDFLAENPISFNLTSFLLMQQALFRIGQSDFMLGGNYIFTKTRVTLFEDNDISWLDPQEFDLINSGLTFIAQYQTFNYFLSPTRGVSIEVDLRGFYEFLGSNIYSQRLTFTGVDYLQVKGEKWVSGFRVESMLASSGTPFFMLPYIDLRGVPAMRYQGEMTMLAETEQYARVYKRWGLVGFTGIGRSIGDLSDWGNGENVWNAGGGFRYLLARKLGLQMGMDVGFSPDAWAFYIIFGSAWLR